MELEQKDSRQCEHAAVDEKHRGKLIGMALALPPSEEHLDNRLAGHL